jgi:hypothetical protein
MSLYRLFINRNYQTFLLYFLDNSKRPCSPIDFLNSTSYFNNDLLESTVGAENTVCLPVCLKTEYQTKITEGRLESEVLQRISNEFKPETLEDPE